MSENEGDLGFPYVPIRTVALQLFDIVKELRSDVVSCGR